MHTKSTTELISMAQAVLVSLIESHKVIEPCEIEDNLVAINSLLVDASISSSQNSSKHKVSDGPLSAIAMLEDLAAEIHESTSLLELIFKNSPDMGETDNALACLIRSMIKTGEKAYEYVEQLSIHAGAECQRGQKLESLTALANQLNSWACDIGYCKLAVYNSMDDIPTESNSIGVLSLVSQKLDEMQSIISSKADKIEFNK